MEMQFFILGHVMLLMICLGFMTVDFSIGTLIAVSDKREPDTTNPSVRALKATLFLFGLAEIIYWVLHWIFV